MRRDSNNFAKTGRRSWQDRERNPEKFFEKVDQWFSIKNDDDHFATPNDIHVEEVDRARLLDELQAGWSDSHNLAP